MGFGFKVLGFGVVRPLPGFHLGTIRVSIFRVVSWLWVIESGVQGRAPDCGFRFRGFLGVLGV